MTDKCPTCGLPDPANNPFCFCGSEQAPHAPERIAIDFDGGGVVPRVMMVGTAGCVEYVRADLTRLEKERE